MVHLASTAVHGREVVADPTPMGLLGLAIGCAALVPIAFGASLTPAGLETAAMFCLLFGAGCQFLAGLLNLVNRNLYGGTLFLTFAFNWIVNWWALHSLAQGFVADRGVVFATEIAFLVIFVLITWGFGHFSSLLFVFLLDIDLIYVFKVAGHVLGTQAFNLPVAILTVGLCLLSLWIAFALLLNPVTGRQVFALGGPLFRTRARAPLDLMARTTITGLLYARWREEGTSPLPFAELLAKVSGFPEKRVRAEIDYLAAQGLVDLPSENSVRLSVSGIDRWEQHILGGAPS
jgi:succinate-acetate transporter protein